MSILIKKIKQAMLDSVIRLEVYQDDQDNFGSNRFYTMWSHHEDCYCCEAIDTTDVPDVDTSQIVMWDIFAEKFVVHAVDNVGIMSVFVDDDGSYDHDRTLETIQKMKDEIQCCCDSKHVKCDNQHVEDVMLHTRTNVQDPEAFDVWYTLKSMNLKFDTIHDLACACDDDLHCMKEEYMNLIRTKREAAFVELDQLEEEAKQAQTSEDDLADIDTIKQMFTDIPQETDLTQYNTFQELFRFWPSLLLPGPNNELMISTIESGDTIKQLVDDDIMMDETLNNGLEPEFIEADTDIDPSEMNFELQQLIDILNEVDEPEQLQELLDIYQSETFTISDEITEEQKIDLHDNPDCEIKVVDRTWIDVIEDRITSLKD